MTVHGCFDHGTAHVKALGALKKKKEDNEDDETRSIFTVSRFVTLVTILSNLLATVR